MRVTLTTELVRKAKPGTTRLFLWDSVVPGLGLVIQPSGNKSWVFQGADTQGRRKTLAAKGLQEARRLASAMKAGIETGPIQPAPRAERPSNSLTMNKLLDAWLVSLAERAMPPSSLPRIQACLDNHVRPRIGDIAFKDLRRPQVLAVRDGLAARGLRGMANQVTAYIRAALRWAEDAGVIEEAPRWRLSRLRLGSRAHALDDTQWARMMTLLSDTEAGLHPIGRLALLALALTGCRKGEIASLRHESVGEDGSLLLLRHKTSARSGAKRIPGNEGLVRVLREARQVVVGLAERQPTPRLREALLKGGYCFPSLARNNMGRGIGRVLDDTWAEVRRRADLPPTMTVHGLRGAYITQAQRMGIPVGTVAAMVGHESPLTTLRHYTAPTPSEVNQTAQRLASWMRDLTAPGQDA